MYKVNIFNYIGALESFPLYIRVMENQQESIWHTHDFVEMVVVMGGSGIHECRNERRRVSTGDVFVIPPETAHRYTDTSEDFFIVNLLYNFDKLPIPLIDLAGIAGSMDFLSGQPVYPLLHLTEENFPEVEKITHTLIHENNYHAPGYLFALLSNFMLLIVTLSRLYCQNETVVKSREVNMDKCLALLQRDFRRQISIEELCHVCSMTKATLLRSFRKATGMTPLQYQIRIRITEALRIMTTSRKSIAEISYEVGFEDRNYFGRQFKRIIGQSPGKYRAEAERDL